MECFAVYSDELKTRIDPLYLKSVYSIQSVYTRYPLIALGDLLEKPPEYGASEIAVDGNPSIDIRYIRITDIDELGNLRNDWKTAKRIDAKYLLQENDILFARSGATAGKTFIYRPEYGKAIFAGYLIRFRVSKTRVNPLFVFYYTQLSRYASWVKAIQRPSGQPNINSQEFKLLKIPLPPCSVQNQIVGIMESAYERRKQKDEEAKRLLDSINGFVLERLGISLPEINDKSCFVVWSDDIKGRKINPQAYTVKPKAIRSAIEGSTYPIKRLSDIVTQNISGEWGEDPVLVKKTDDHVLCRVLRNTNIVNQYNLNFENVAERLIRKDKYQKIRLKKGDILIEKSGGSPTQPVGRVALVESTSEGYAFSNFVQLLRISEECIPQYLFIFLKAVYALNYMEYLQNQTTGIKNLIMSEYLSIPIPIPPLEVQKVIADKVESRMQKAEQLQKEAEEEVEKAKAEVEKMILAVG